MKPVALVAAMLANSSPEGGGILDPFSGSGSTIIAAEQLGRRCYAMDIDPRYVAGRHQALGRLHRPPGGAALMGRRGPAPAPLEVKLLRGEQHRDRLNFAEPKPRLAQPFMPRDMSDRAKTIWREVVRDHAPGVIRAIDAGLLRTYCEAVARYEGAMRLYASPLISTRGSVVANPLSRIVRAETDTIRLACERGLGPRPPPLYGLAAEPGEDLEGLLGPPAAHPGGRRWQVGGPRCPHRRPPLRRLLRALHPPHQGPVGRPAAHLRGLAARVLVGGARVRPRHRPAHLQRGRPRASRARTPSRRWPAPAASTCSTPTARTSPRSTSAQLPATRRASSSASRAAWSSAARCCSDRLIALRYSIECPRNGGIMRSLSSDGALQHGLNPSANIIDELHAHKNGRALHRPHHRHRRARAAVHALDQHGRRGRRGDPGRPLRVDVLRHRRARGPRLAAHLPRPGQRHAHLLVRRPARCRHRGSRGLAGLQSRLLAGRRQVPRPRVRAAQGARRAPRVAPLPPQPVRRLRGHLAARGRLERDGRRPAAQRRAPDRGRHRQEPRWRAGRHRDRAAPGRSGRGNGAVVPRRVCHRHGQHRSDARAAARAAQRVSPLPQTRDEKTKRSLPGPPTPSTAPPSASRPRCSSRTG